MLGIGFFFYYTYSENLQLFPRCMILWYAKIFFLSLSLKPAAEKGKNIFLIYSQLFSNHFSFSQPPSLLSSRTPISLLFLKPLKPYLIPSSSSSMVRIPGNSTSPGRKSRHPYSLQVVQSRKRKGILRDIITEPSLSPAAATPVPT